MSTTWVSEISCFHSKPNLFQGNVGKKEITILIRNAIKTKVANLGSIKFLCEGGHPHPVRGRIPPNRSILYRIPVNLGLLLARLLFVLRNTEVTCGNGNHNPHPAFCRDMWRKGSKR